MMKSKNKVVAAGNQIAELQNLVERRTEVALVLQRRLDARLPSIK